MSADQQLEPHRCCEEASAGADCGRNYPTVIRRGIGVSRWLVPSAVLALMPKCPVCIAAYLAIGTGAGVSISTATHLRMMLLALCGSALFFLAAQRVRGLIQQRAQTQREFKEV